MGVTVKSDVYMCVYIYIYVCVCVCVCVCVYIYIYIYIYIHIYIYIYTHTLTHTHTHIYIYIYIGLTRISSLHGCYRMELPRANLIPTLAVPQAMYASLYVCVCVYLEREREIPG